jgi:hypothetical protein
MFVIALENIDFKAKKSFFRTNFIFKLFSKVCFNHL